MLLFSVSGGDGGGDGVGEGVDSFSLPYISSNFSNKGFVIGY